MHIPHPVTAVRSAVVSTFTNQFVPRLAISLILTGLDGSVLAATLPVVYAASASLPWLLIGFTCLIFGLLATLARVWFLTFRYRRLE
jgi:hypothetical protein